MAFILQRSLATQPLISWTGYNSGQTIDAHSFAAIALDDSGTLFIAVHVYQTNQPNTQLYIQYALDGGPAVPGGPSAPPHTIFTTDATGTGNVAFSIPNMALTSHTVVVEVNTMSWNTYYVNQTNPTGISIPWPPPN